MIVVSPGAGTARLISDETGSGTTPPGATMVCAGDVLAHVVARGGEKPVTAPHDAVVVEWLVEDGDPVERGSAAGPPAANPA